MSLNPVAATSPLGPDGQVSWMVAYAATWNTFCGGLLRRSAPVLFGPISDAFMGSRRQPTAWLITLIYSFAFLLGPLVTALIRNEVPSLQTLSLCATLCIGLSQVISFFLADVFAFVLVLGVLCGVGSGVTLVVNETILSMHFLHQRRMASNMGYCGTLLAVLIYPLLLLKLVDVYGLHGALLITGGLTFNGLAGSVILSKPTWYHSAELPVPVVTAAEITSAKTTGEMVHSQDDAVLPVPPDPNQATALTPVAQKDSEIGQVSVSANVMFGDTENTGKRAAGTRRTEDRKSSGQPGGGDDVPGIKTAVGGSMEPATVRNSRHAPDGEPLFPGENATQTLAVVDDGFGGSMFAPMAVLCTMLLAPTFSVVTLLFDFVADELQHGTAAGFAVLVGAAIGDVFARLQAQELFKRTEIRQVLAVECFINGGFLFLLAMIKVGPVVFLLALALGWTSGSFVMILMPLLSTFLLSSRVQATAVACRCALAAALPVGPFLVGSLKDGGGSYTWLFVLAGGSSVIGGFIWLPGILTPKLRARVACLAPHGQEQLGLSGGAILAPDEIVNIQVDGGGAFKIPSPSFLGASRNVPATDKDATKPETLPADNTPQP
ncbi:unnamed protein product [Ixodes pacificus]